MEIADTLNLTDFLAPENWWVGICTTFLLGRLVLFSGAKYPYHASLSGVVFLVAKLLASTGLDAEHFGRQGRWQTHLLRSGHLCTGFGYRGCLLPVGNF